jgi:hypothetical protein
LEHAREEEWRGAPIHLVYIYTEGAQGWQDTLFIHQLELIFVHNVRLRCLRKQLEKGERERESSKPNHLV